MVSFSLNCDLAGANEPTVLEVHHANPHVLDLDYRLAAGGRGDVLHAEV